MLLKAFKYSLKPGLLLSVGRAVLGFPLRVSEIGASMFGFLSMAHDVDARRVQQDRIDKLFVSTMRVTDSIYPYETAIEHPLYNNGVMIIVENYNSKKAAQNGHKKWLKKMTSKKLPAKIADVGQSEVQRTFCPGKREFVRNKK